MLVSSCFCLITFPLSIGSFLQMCRWTMVFSLPFTLHLRVHSPFFIPLPPVYSKPLSFLNRGISFLGGRSHIDSLLVFLLLLFSPPVFFPSSSMSLIPNHLLSLISRHWSCAPPQTTDFLINP